MERLYYSSKMYLTNLQLYYCCWLLPVRIGLFLIGYLTILVDLIFMMGIVSEDIEPTVLSVQNELFQNGNISKPMPVVAYGTELGFNVVLLCGLHNKDLVLIQLYFYYTIFAVLLSFMTYSLVLAALTIKYKLAIIFSTLFQIYCVLLVRSLIVNMKIKQKIYAYSRFTDSPNLSPTLNYKYPKTNDIALKEIPSKETRIVIIENERMKYTKPADITNEEIQVRLARKAEEKKMKEQRAIVKQIKISQKAEEKRIKDLEKAEERRIREEKREEEKRIKDQQRAEEERVKALKIEENRIKEQRKAVEKRSKEEQRLEEIRLKEEKRAEERRLKEEQKSEQERIKQQKIEEIRIKEERKAAEKRSKEEQKLEKIRIKERKLEEIRIKVEQKLEQKRLKGEKKAEEKPNKESEQNNGSENDSEKSKE